MDRTFSSIVVLGTGKVGSLVATLLHDSGFDVLGVDARERNDLPCPVQAANVTDDAELRKILEGKHAVVSCLPYNLNMGVVQAAHDLGIHYFDLTEDVPTTKKTMELSSTAKGVMAPQCGLAPGFIGIVGSSLARNFETTRSIELRVGALPQHPSGLLGYAFNWSAEGVVNEYLNDCEVIQNGKKMWVPAMTGNEQIIINGIVLEAFATSGGLGTMCDTFENKTDKLNYKTMRYPGHCDLMRFFFHELHMKQRRDEAGDILVHAKPPVNDDVVYVHAAVEGMKGGELFREEFVEAYYPIMIGDQLWRAISWTTACSICAVIEMVAESKLPNHGFIKQEDIPLDDFLATKNGGYYNHAVSKNSMEIVTA